MMLTRKLLFTIFVLLPTASFAQSYGAGAVADNLMQPIGILASFISSGSIVIGVFSLFAAFVKYLQYRVNPMQSPLSTVMLLVVMGAILLLLPLTYQLTIGATP